MQLKLNMSCHLLKFEWDKFQIDISKHVEKSPQNADGRTDGHFHGVIRPVFFKRAYRNYSNQTGIKALVWYSRSLFKLIEAGWRIHVSIILPPMVQIIACRQAIQLNQCWNVVDWTLRNKLQWRFTKFLYFIQENAFENVVWKTTAISSRAQ